MKKLLLSFAALAFSITASAQYYHSAPVSGSNPNNVNQENSEYPVGSGLPTDWTSILSAAQTAGTYSSVQTLPFTFKLQGSAIDSFRVSNTFHSVTLTYNFKNKYAKKPMQHAFHL